MFFMVGSSLKNVLYFLFGLVLFSFCDDIVEYLTGKVKLWNVTRDVSNANRMAVRYLTAKITLLLLAVLCYTINEKDTVGRWHR